MDNIEYRSIIKFYLKLGKSAEETMDDMKKVYNDAWPSKATVYYWRKEFKNGRESVNDVVSGGGPIEISDVKKEMCEKLIQENWRIKIAEIAIE